MKFHPARQVAAPHSNTAGIGAAVGATDAPKIPLKASFAVNTSGLGAGVVSKVTGVVNALPIVENDIGSQKTCTPMPCARMSVCRMPLMRNVLSMLATPGTELDPESGLTVSPNVVCACSAVRGSGTVQTTSSTTGTLPNPQRRHFSAAPEAPGELGSAPSPNGTRMTFSRLSPPNLTDFFVSRFLAMVALSFVPRRFLVRYGELRCFFLSGGF